MLHAHLLHEPPADHLAYLHRSLHDDVIITAGDDMPENVQILIAGRPNREHLERVPALEALLIPFAGLPAVTREVMADFPQITVHNLHHNAPMTAEMALALLFSAAKMLVPVDHIFRTHDWTPRYQPVPSVVLDGKTALILGYGEIGQRLGTVLQALNVRVMGIRRTVREDDDPDVVFPPEKLHALLPQANILIVALPGTPETEGLIGAEELALVPARGLVVNIGRAAVIDEMALYTALKEGNLFAAGLDVWYRYPTDSESRTHTPPADFPFHELDNVVLSPHRAGGGGTEEVEQRRMAGIAASLNARALGNPMPHQVNLEAGY